MFTGALNDLISKLALVNKMMRSNLFFYCVSLFIVINIYSELVLAEEDQVAGLHATSINKNVDYPGNYEDVS